MAENISFSISRKGYNCLEVDEFISATRKAEKQLKESYSSMQEKYDTLYAENVKLREEKERLYNDCTALAIALQKFRTQAAEVKEEPEVHAEIEDAEEDVDVQEAEEIQPDSVRREEYDRVVAENAQLKADNEALKEELAKADKAVVTEASESYSETATKMISEVALVVQKLEKDAQRKADAITVAAKLEQEKAKLVKDRVDHEVRSLMSMLESFIEEADKADTEETE